MADSAKFIQNATETESHTIRSGKELAHFCGVSTAKMDSVRKDKALGFPEPVFKIGKNFCAVYDKRQVTQWLEKVDIRNATPMYVAQKQWIARHDMTIKTNNSLDQSLALSFLMAPPIYLQGETYE